MNLTVVYICVLESAISFVLAAELYFWPQLFHTFIIIKGLFSVKYHYSIFCCHKLPISWIRLLVNKAIGIRDFQLKRLWHKHFSFVYILQRRNGSKSSQKEAPREKKMWECVWIRSTIGSMCITKRKCSYIFHVYSQTFKKGLIIMQENLWIQWFDLSCFDCLDTSRFKIDQSKKGFRQRFVHELTDNG